jgi:hypothetical protein
MSKLFSGCFGKLVGSSHKSHPKKVTSKQRSIRRLSFSDVSNSGIFSPEDLSISLVGSNLYVFTIAELQTATQGFSMSNFIGEGGFGPVYKGYVDEKVKPGLKAQSVAVKLLDLDGVQGHKEWLVSFLHFYLLLTYFLVPNSIFVRPFDFGFQIYVIARMKRMKNILTKSLRQSRGINCYHCAIRRLISS